MAEKKKPEERRHEILDVAEEIFATKGYENASIEDLLKALQLSKGGFYHHFKSKEEVLDGIILRYTQRMVEGAKQVVARPEVNAKDKLQMLLAAIRISNAEEEILEELHRPENRTMHLKSLIESTVCLAPYFGEVARQGINEGSFHMDSPDEIMEALFIIASLWFDDAFFDLTAEQKQRRAIAFMEMAEKCTGVEKGSISFV